jgi:hypothetical protein
MPRFKNRKVFLPFLFATQIAGANKLKYILKLQVCHFSKGFIKRTIAWQEKIRTEGNSGRAGFAHGMLATALSLGSTLSNLSAGFIVNAAGFKIGFVFLSALALGALILLWKAMPETIRKQNAAEQERLSPAI